MDILIIALIIISLIIVIAYFVNKRYADKSNDDDTNALHGTEVKIEDEALQKIIDEESLPIINAINYRVMCKKMSCPFQQFYTDGDDFKVYVKAYAAYIEEENDFYWKRVTNYFIFNNYTSSPLSIEGYQRGTRNEFKEHKINRFIELIKAYQSLRNNRYNYTLKNGDEILSYIPQMEYTEHLDED